MSKYVIYTCLFGPNLDLFEQPQYESIDYICFTDQEDLTSNSWDIYLVEPSNELNAHFQSRYYKLLPHKVLPSQYELSIYIDSNFLVYQNPICFFEELSKDNHFLCFSHDETSTDPRDCIYEEITAIQDLKEKTGRYFDSDQNLEETRQLLLREGYPKHNGLIKGGVLFRNHHHHKVKHVMEEWWQMIQTYSRRDQLSFNYVAWKHDFDFRYLKGDIRKQNPFFYMVSDRGSNIYWRKLKAFFRTYKLRNQFEPNCKAILKGII